jgi:AraC-like DNA-binding protein
MSAFVDQGRIRCLERSCEGGVGDWIRIAPPSDGLERVEARFSGHAFAPHRHDTYAIGFTLAGVQSFRYRGASERSLPGQVFVLHPDELHDGQAGGEGGFGYRIAYVAPRLVQDALGASGEPLPFVRQVVSEDRRLRAAAAAALDDLEMPLSDMARDRIIADLADALVGADRSARRPTLSAIHWRAVRHARELIDARLDGVIRSAELEAATGLNRYTLARHFRACLGTSPCGYLIMRRLDRARSLIRLGAPLAEAALASGFADQSHMSRQFKQAYGLSPGRWAAFTRAGAAQRKSERPG